jgi:hypothetical protein
VKTRQAIQKSKSPSMFEDDTRATAQVIIALVRTRDDAEAPVRRLLRAYAARARASSDAKAEQTQKTRATPPAQRGGDQRHARRGATKHICDRCRHKHLEIAMQQVARQDGEYGIWTEGRAAYFRSHSLKYPTLVWLCRPCYTEASRAQAEEARTGEPAPLPPARSAAKRRPQGQKAKKSRK